MTCQSGTCQSVQAAPPTQEAAPPPTTCVARDGACAATPECCTSLTCMKSTCQVDCPATLTAHGCSLNGNGTWNCGNTGGHPVNLAGANLSACNLTEASFYETDLTRALLADTNLTGANFNGATVTNVDWDHTTCPAGVNSDANGDTCCGKFLYSQKPTGCS